MEVLILQATEKGDEMLHVGLQADIAVRSLIKSWSDYRSYLGLKAMSIACHLKRVLKRHRNRNDVFESRENGKKGSGVLESRHDKDVGDENETI